MINEYAESSQMTISVVSFENQAIETVFLYTINTSYNELKKLIPNLPNNLKLTFGTSYDYGEDGVTGSAIAADLIQIGINPEVDDRSKQFAKIRSLIFHEGFHLAQGFYLDGRQFSAVESAVYEGCATIFERDFAGSNPAWGDYASEDEQTLRRWYEEMKTISAEQYFEPSGNTWRKWAFYDAETGEGWRIYKVGAWLVDSVLKKEDMNVMDLSSKTANEILEYL
jgi:uncharacterized protein YjaZ